MTATPEPLETETVDEPDVVATTSTPGEDESSTVMTTPAETTRESGEEVLPTARATAETDSSDFPDAAAPVDVSNAALIVIPPVDIPEQIQYLPPQAGGGAMTTECLGRAQEYARQESKPAPFVGIFGQPVDIGAKMTICYIGFTSQTIKETIIGPDGKIIQSVTFTAEIYYPPLSYPVDADATDYMVMPNDLPGTYTFMAETPQGTITQAFNVTDQVMAHRIITNMAMDEDDPFVTVLSRGTSQNAPSALRDGVIFLSGFFPNESVTLTFWRACKAEQRGSFFGPTAIEFVISAQTQVNSDGRTFVTVPDEIADAMQDIMQYELGVIGTQTPNLIGDGILEKFNFSAILASTISLPTQDTPPCSSRESGERQQYQVIQTQDGFVTVRAEPTTSSASQARLDPGTIVDCTDIVMGETIAGSSEWAYCPEAGGYIFLDLLTPYSEEGQRYQVIQTQDGFVTVRAEATTSSTSQARLDPGTIVDCTDIVMGETIAGSSEWAYCPEAGGYIFLDLLIPCTPDESSTSDTCGTATVIEVEALSIQDNPSVNADSLGAVEQGQSVDVLCVDSVEAEGRIWVRVRYGLTEGWMSTRYLQQ